MRKEDESEETRKKYEKLYINRYYPFLNKILSKILPNTIKIIDSGEAVAKQTKALINKHKINKESNQGNYSFYCNGDSSSLSKILDKKYEINII